MSLYHESAEILTLSNKDGGSLKSHVFGRKTWKTDGRILFALTAEAAKWSTVLSEVVEKSGILKVEKNLTPILALLLTHDLLLAKKGIALPQSHGLNTTISRHRARLSAELTKLRIRRGFASLDELRAHVNSENAGDVQLNADGSAPYRHPRWIRINTLKTTLEDELATTFASYTKVQTLGEITHAVPGSRMLHIDQHVPNLIATVGPEDPSRFKSYKEGRFIFQEKASCFPAYLLDPKPGQGDVIDACAAPGNKTTHLASILGSSGSVEDDSQTKCRITACEKDVERSKTLDKMVRLAGANKIVTIKAKQDFLRIDPRKKDVANVIALLLDPSCSGSGIVGRDEASVSVRLPSATSTEDAVPRGKKRKRNNKPSKPEPEADPEVPVSVEEEETPDNIPEADADKLAARLEKLSTFQLRLLQHAMSFPAARRITYSTCSVHAEENENVVVRALCSEIAVQRGWHVLKRPEQVDGMRRWNVRGKEEAVRLAAAAEVGSNKVVKKMDFEEVAEACIRCDKAGEEGTMGFFVAGFVRSDSAQATEGLGEEKERESDEESDEESEFEGFD